jgi:hypothetical protein
LKPKGFETHGRRRAAADVVGVKKSEKLEKRELELHIIQLKLNLCRFAFCYKPFGACKSRKYSDRESGHESRHCP